MINLFFSRFGIIPVSAIVILLFFPLYLWASPKKIPISQPRLPNFIPAMGNPDFWIKKLPNPQQVIWSKDKIRIYNQANLKKGRVLNPLVMGNSIKSDSLKIFLDQDLRFIRTYIKYDTEGVRRRDPEFGNFLREIINYDDLEKSHSLQIMYGMVVNKEIELRYFPTDLKVYRTLEDREFEILKKTHLDMLSPLAILWESHDRNWFYVETPFSRGWVKKKYVVTGSRSDIQNFFQEESKGVVINLLAKTYAANKGENGEPEEYSPISLPMGTTVFYRKYDSDQEFTEIIFPEEHLISGSKKLVKTVLLVKSEDISVSPIPFTYENLVRQSFKFLGSKYSWGGSYDKTDCSLFLYRLYRSFGLILPRSSSQQIISLEYKDVFPRYQEYSNNLLPLRVIAHIPGPTHILLYLGKHEGVDFYIHSTWSYYDSQKNEYLIRSVVVSDLSLGQGSKLGSLENRIKFLGFF